jgi:hypothetical protein
VLFLSSVPQTFVTLMTRMILLVLQVFWSCSLKGVDLRRKWLRRIDLSFLSSSLSFDAFIYYCLIYYCSHFRLSGFHPPHVRPLHRYIAVGMGATAWFWIMYRLKQDGAVMFGLKAKKKKTEVVVLFLTCFVKDAPWVEDVKKEEASPRDNHSHH